MRTIKFRGQKPSDGGWVYGSLVYEGDILKVPYTQEGIEVRFVRGVFAFLWNGDLDDEAPINAPTQEWAEVIGNSHDNPELLKMKR